MVCDKCGRQPIGSYWPSATRTYLCPYCNEGARLRDEGVVVDNFMNVCHEACLDKARAAAPATTLNEPDGKSGTMADARHERLPSGSLSAAAAAVPNEPEEAT